MTGLALVLLLVTVDCPAPKLTECAQSGDYREPSLIIHVTDTTSGTIPGAEVAVVPHGKQSPVAKRTTDREGTARFYLLPGAFDVEVSHPGFKTKRLRKVRAVLGTAAISIGLSIDMRHAQTIE
jgi:hypothetical protein